MKILIVSKNGESLGLSQKLVREGHEVRFYIKSAGFQYAGLGIVKRENAFRPFLSWAHLIISDSLGFGHLENLIRSKGVPFVGFNSIADLIGMDGKRMLQVLERFQIPYPSTQIFDTPEIAEDLVKDWTPLGYIVKPVYSDDGHSYTCKTPEEYMYALSNYSGHVSVMAQEIVEGVDVCVQGWFNGDDWVEAFSYVFEERRFLDGNRGANAICMGAVMVPVSRMGVLVELLKRLAPFLNKAGYVGPVTLYTMVKDKEYRICSMIAGFTYDAIEAFVGLMDENIGEFLYDIAMGKRKYIKLHSGFGMAVRLTIPPYPTPINSEVHGRPLPNNLQNDEYFLLADCYKNRIMQTGDKGLFWAASTGVIGKVIGHERNLTKLHKEIYGKISEVDIQDLQFRRDIGLRVDKDLKRLRRSKVI